MQQQPSALFATLQLPFGFWCPFSNVHTLKNTAHTYSLAKPIEKYSIV